MAHRHPLPHPDVAIRHGLDSSLLSAPERAALGEISDPATRDILASAIESTRRIQRNFEAIEIRPTPSGSGEGKTGPPGPEGPEGPAGLVWRGAWSAIFPYFAVNEAVTYKGSSWRTKKANTGKAPDVNPEYWELIAEKGAEGGGGGGDKSYTHEQGVASNEWTVNHELGKIPCVVVFDGTGQEYQGEEIVVTLNQIKLQFNAAISGKAVVN